MDQWDFKKWRKKLGINQIEAGDMLGLSRAAVQCWESEIRPVPRTVELACKELSRRWWKQGPQFGPVILLYAETPISLRDTPTGIDLVLRCEPYPNNQSALARVLRLRETASLFMPLIVENDATVIWSGPELLRECEAKKGARLPR
jgi:transcriptional regulator with XRE-family HTH domain